MHVCLEADHPDFKGTYAWVRMHGIAAIFCSLAFLQNVPKKKIVYKDLFVQKFTLLIACYFGANVKSPQKKDSHIPAAKHFLFHTGQGGDYKLAPSNFKPKWIMQPISIIQAEHNFSQFILLWLFLGMDKGLKSYP